MSCPVAAESSWENCWGCGNDDQVALWLVAAGGMAITALVTIAHLTLHARYYYHAGAQKQVMRVLLMPLVYGSTAFLGFRYYHHFGAFHLIAAVYEAITMAAFLLLLLELTMAKERDQGKNWNDLMKEKGHQPLMWTCGLIHYWPERPYFRPLILFSVLQFVIIRPITAAIEVALDQKNMDCGTISTVLSACNAVSALVALYGLWLFQHLLKPELRDRKPMRKCLSIKLLVGVVLLQSFVIELMVDHGYITAGSYYTAEEQGEAYEAILIVVEMAVFASFMCHSFDYREFTPKGKAFPKAEDYVYEDYDQCTDPESEGRVRRADGTYGYWRAVWDAVGIWDFRTELGKSLKYFERSAMHTRHRKRNV